MEVQFIRHLLHFYVHHPGFLHNHKYHLEKYQIHVSYHYYHHLSLAYFYIVVVFFRSLPLQCYYPLFIFYLGYLVFELFYSLSLKFPSRSFLSLRGIQSFSGETFIILFPCADILETIRVPLLNVSFLHFILFVCCFLVSLSSKLAD